MRWRLFGEVYVFCFIFSHLHNSFHFIGNPGELYHLKGRCIVTVWLEMKLLCSIGLWYRIIPSLHHSRAYVFTTWHNMCMRYEYARGDWIAKHRNNSHLLKTMRRVWVCCVDLFAVDKSLNVPFQEQTSMGNGNKIHHIWPDLHTQLVVCSLTVLCAGALQWICDSSVPSNL